MQIAVSLDLPIAERAFFCKDTVSGWEAGGVRLCRSFRCSESKDAEAMLALQSAERKKDKGFGVRSIARWRWAGIVRLICSLLNHAATWVLTACGRLVRCLPAASLCSPRWWWIRWRQTRNCFSFVPITSLPGHTEAAMLNTWSPPRFSLPHIVRDSRHSLARQSPRGDTRWGRSSCLLGCSRTTRHFQSVAASGRKFPAALALPLDRDGAQRRACAWSPTTTNLLSYSEDGRAPDAVINAPWARSSETNGADMRATPTTRRSAPIPVPFLDTQSPLSVRRLALDFEAAEPSGAAPDRVRLYLRERSPKWQEFSATLEQRNGDSDPAKRVVTSLSARIRGPIEEQGRVGSLRSHLCQFQEAGPRWRHQPLCFQGRGGDWWATAAFL